MKCQHEFEHLTFVRRKFLWFTTSIQSYSKCVKCGILRHDNDGDLFWE